MADQDADAAEKIADGPLGRVVGKVKSTVGSLLGDDDLQREGNLQQAHVDAAAEAERHAAAARQAAAEVDVEEEQIATVAERDALRAEIAAEDDKERVREAEAQAMQKIEEEASRAEAAAAERERRREAAVDAPEDWVARRRPRPRWPRPRPSRPRRPGRSRWRT